MLVVAAHDPTATAALWVSFGSLAVSSVALLAGVAMHRQSGPRVRVVLGPMIMTDYGTIREKQPKLGWPADLNDQGTAPRRLELARITVTNIGRSPTMVDSIGLHTQAGWSGRKRAGHVSRPLPLGEFGGVTDFELRIEPGEYVTVFMFPWDLVHSRAVTAGRPIWVRASARVAGRRRLAKSPWRWRWTVTPAQLTMSGGPPTEEDVIYRRVWLDLQAKREPSPPVPICVHMDVLEAWQDRPAELSKREARVLITEAIGDQMIVRRMLAYDLVEDLEMAGFITDPVEDSAPG